MKLGLVAIASAIAVATTQGHTAAREVACDLVTLAKLVLNPNLLPCTLVTGFSILSPIIPTPALISSMCACDACLDYYENIRDGKLPNCVIAGTVNLVDNILGPIDAACYEDYDPDGDGPATTLRRRRPRP